MNQVLIGAIVLLLVLAFCNNPNDAGWDAPRPYKVENGTPPPPPTTDR